MVLSTDSPGAIPFGIGFPLGGSLEVLHELHDGKRTDGVPGRLSRWVSVLVQADHLWWRGVSASSTEADSMNFPWAGTAFVPLKF